MQNLVQVHLVFAFAVCTVQNYAVSPCRNATHSYNIHCVKVGWLAYASTIRDVEFDNVLFNIEYGCKYLRRIYANNIKSLVDN